jgi:rifamycin polyketide synthase module 4/5/6
MAVSRLSASDHPWLADRAAVGHSTVPTSAWIELAIKAGDERDCGVLAEFELEAPLTLAADEAVRLRVCVEGPGADGRRAVTVHSAPAGADRYRPAWTRHAAGFLAPTAAESWTGTDFTRWPPAGAQPVGPDAVPAETTGCGRCSVWRRGDEVFAELSLAHECRDDAVRYGIHPALLDAVTQMAEFAIGEVPSSWRQVTLHAAGASSLRIRLAPAAGGGLTAEAADDAGAPVLTVGRIAGRPRPIAAAVSGDGVLRVGWHEIDAKLAPAPVSIVTVEDDADVLSLAGAQPDAYKPLVALLDVGVGADPAAACRRVLTVAQAWLDEPDLEPRPLVVLTRGATQAGQAAEPGTDLAGATVWAMITAIQADYPGRVVLVDVTADVAGLPDLGFILAAGVSQAAIRGDAALLPRLIPAGMSGGVPALDLDGSVLILGGTGSAGARTARHLVSEHGIRHLILAGRRGSGAAGAQELVGELAALGASATLVACDGTDPEAVRRLLAGVPEDHPLTGVVHAAGIPDDTPLAELDSVRLTEVLTAHTESLGNLAGLTADLDLGLFAVVTSTARLLGPARYAATAAAEGFAAAVVAQRRATGRCGAAPVLLPSPVAGQEDGRGMSALAAAVRSGEPFPVPGRPDVWAGLPAGKAVPALLRGLVRRRRRLAYTAEVREDDRRRLTGELSGRTPAEREQAVLELVGAQLAAVLGLDPTEPVRPDRGFFELGLDSLMAVELCKRLGGYTGAALSPAAIFSNPTPAALAGYLLGCLAGA